MCRSTSMKITTKTGQEERNTPDGYPISFEPVAPSLLSNLIEVDTYLSLSTTLLL